MSFNDVSNYDFNILENTLLGEHFLLIKNKFANLLEELNNEQLLNQIIRFLKKLD